MSSSGSAVLPNGGTADAANDLRPNGGTAPQVHARLRDAIAEHERSCRPRRRVAVLGSTGSIGTQTLDVARRHPDRLEIVALAAGTRVDELLAQALSALQAAHAAIAAGGAFDVAKLAAVEEEAAAIRRLG